MRVKEKGEVIKYHVMAEIPPAGATTIKEKLQEAVQNLSQDGGYSKMRYG